MSWTSDVEDVTPSSPDPNPNINQLMHRCRDKEYEELAKDIFETVCSFSDDNNEAAKAASPTTPASPTGNPINLTPRVRMQGREGDSRLTPASPTGNPINLTPRVGR